MATPLEKALSKKMNEIQDGLLILWLEVAKDYGYEYKIEEQGERKVAVPVDEEVARQAKLQNFGSVTLAIPATFWFKKARDEFERRAKKVLNDNV